MTLFIGVGRIPLHDKSGVVVAWATVDLADFARVRESTWSLAKNGYVRRHVPSSRPKRKETLHRFILGLVPGDGVHTDHKDRDRLNNRRGNLRVGTQADNNQNTSGWSHASSQYRGVCWYARGACWQAEVTLGRKRYYLGRFENELDAARAAAEFRGQHMPFSEEATAA